MLTNLNLHRLLSSVSPHICYAQHQVKLIEKENYVNNTETLKRVAETVENPVPENNTNVKFLLACVYGYIHNLIISCAQQDPNAMVRQIKKQVHFTDYNAYIQKLSGYNYMNESDDTTTATHYKNEQDSHYFGHEPREYTEEEYASTEGEPEYEVWVPLFSYEDKQFIINPTIFTD